MEIFHVEIKCSQVVTCSVGWPKSQLQNMPQIIPTNISPNYPGEAAASKTKQEEMFKFLEMLVGG